MSKRKAHINIKRRGGSDQYEPVKRKANERLRPVSTDTGAAITDNPFYLFAYTGVIMALLFTLKLIL